MRGFSGPLTFTIVMADRSRVVSDGKLIDLDVQNPAAE